MTNVSEIIASLQAQIDEFPERQFPLTKVRRSDIRALVEEVRRLEGHVELLQSKIDADTSCACSFDKPDDVCAVHSPRLAAAEAELARLRTPAGEVEEFARSLLHEAKEFVPGSWRRQRYERASDLITRLAAENDRLRTPAGEVGEVVRSLEAASEDLTRRTYSDRCESPRCAIASNVATRAAELLTRQAAEIEGLTGKLEVAMSIVRGAKAAHDAEQQHRASLREAVEVIRTMRFRANVLPLTYGYRIVLAADAFLAKLEKTND